MLDDAAKRTAARIAVAEVQTHHAVWSMAQLRFEVHRALPVLPLGADGEAVVTEVARLAVSGRAGAEVVQVTAPDIADVTGLGVRASDGGSIYRPPNEERYCTLAHLDTEEQILAAAKRTMPQLVSEEQARAAAVRTDLSAEQRDAVITMLTATTAAAVLIAPAGAGKSHTMAEFARLWTTFTGRRVIGLTTSTNAARVLAHEGLAESYNIAQFLGKIEGSDELRRPVPLHRDDVLVLDEASQLDTADLAMITEAARQAGARIIATGDTAQLGAVEAGGMFRLLAREVPAAELHEVRRFAAPSGNGRPASGSATATWPRSPPTTGTAGSAAPTRKPPTTAPPPCGSPTTCAARTCCCWPDPTPKPPTYPAGCRPSSPSSAASDRRRPRCRTATTPGPATSSAPASTPEIDAGGRQLTNRDTLKVTAFRGPDAEVRRQRLDGTWTETFRVPRAYLARNAELAYAGNVHVAQGRTVDTAHLLVTESPVPAGPVRRHDPGPRSQHRARGHRQDRPPRARAVPASRPRIRARQHACSATGTTCRPPSRSATPRNGPGNRSPAHPAPPPRPATALPAATPNPSSPHHAATTRPVRHRADPPGPGLGRGTGHLLTLWSAAIRQALYPDIDEQITARLTESEAWRYQREHSRRPCSSSCATPSSPGTTSPRSSTGSPPPRWTAPGRSPASCTAACSSIPLPSSPDTT